MVSKGVQKITVSLARLLNADGVRMNGGSLNPRAGGFRTRTGWIGKIFSERYHAHYLDRGVRSRTRFLTSSTTP